MSQQILYTAVVESRDDPLKLGRLQVRVFGAHTESLEDIPVSSLPWAIPIMPATSASLSGIGNSVPGYVEGTTVFVIFMDGESKQQPIIIGSFHGIPTDKSPFGANGKLTSESIETAKVSGEAGKNTVTGNEVTDSNGTPVTDSAGEPVKTETPSEELDISKMSAKYGPNVAKMLQALKDAGITDKNAQAAILANVAKESEFKPRRESMNYSSVDRLRAVFSSKFSSMSDAEAQGYVNNEEKLANLVYSNSDGNGSVASGDGYKYRGGGMIQLTKKNNYASVGKGIGVDLVANPDKINDPDVACKATAQYFVKRYGGANKVKFDTPEAALADVTKKVNPGGAANDMAKVNAAAKLIVMPDDTKDKEKKKVEQEGAKPNAPANDVVENATQEQIDAGMIGGESFKTGTSTTSNLGFKDPNKKYPLSSRLKEQDTNRLARRNTDGTPVKFKTDKRRSGMRSIGSDFDEPQPPYNGKYPYNHVYFTESGHMQEFDDTPDAERIHTYHTSGTYEEIDKYGNQVNKIVGDSFTIVERNGYVYIDGTARVTVNSDVKLVVAGNLEVEVDGDVTYDVGGNVTWKVGGNLEYGISGKHSVSSGGITAIDSSQVQLNSGMASMITPSARSGSSNDYPLQVPDNYSGAEVLDLDDADPEDVDAYYAKAVSEGKVTKKQLQEGEQKVKESPPAEQKDPPKVDPKETNCMGFEKGKDIPESTQLSSKFSLAMLSTKATVSSYKVVAQAGLRDDEIVCNLKKLAENCLDKIKNKYPNMSVTSAFRSGSGTSQHCKGQAADMQFAGVSKSDYFEVAKWIRDNVLYDQLLLEYKTTGTGNPWIHISYNSGGNRQQVMTFMNDKSVAQGLKNLA